MTVKYLKLFLYQIFVHFDLKLLDLLGFRLKVLRISARLN